MTKTIIQIELDTDALESHVAGRTVVTPASSVSNAGLVKALVYGWQRCINDKTGGKPEKERFEIQDATIARLVDGTIVLRQRGEGEPEINTFIRAIVRKMVLDESPVITKVFKDAAKKKTEYARIPSADQKARADWLFDLFESMPEKVGAMIEASAQAKMDAAIAQRKADRDMLAELASLDVDLSK